MQLQIQKLVSVLWKILEGLITKILFLHFSSRTYCEYRNYYLIISNRVRFSELALSYIKSNATYFTSQITMIYIILAKGPFYFWCLLCRNFLIAMGRLTLWRLIKRSSFKRLWCTLLVTVWVTLFKKCSL